MTEKRTKAARREVDPQLVLDLAMPYVKAAAASEELRWAIMTAASNLAALDALRDDDPGNALAVAIDWFATHTRGVFLEHSKGPSKPSIKKLGGLQ